MTTEPNRPDTCPHCRHAAHGDWCPNMASDNDCNCTGQPRPVGSAAAREADERMVFTGDGAAREVLRQVGWHGQSGRFYEMGMDPSISERGSFAPVWEVVDTERTEDVPGAAGRHARSVLVAAFGAVDDD